MSIITIVSPDRLSMSMFADFCKNNLPASNCIIKDINDLHSIEIKEAVLNELLKTYNKDELVILRYKTKKSLQRSVPLKYEEVSSYIVHFDQYSNTPVVLKAKDDGLNSLLEKWAVLIKKQDEVN